MLKQIFGLVAITVLSTTAFAQRGAVRGAIDMIEPGTKMDREAIKGLVDGGKAKGLSDSTASFLGTRLELVRTEPLARRILTDARVAQTVAKLDSKILEQAFAGETASKVNELLKNADMSSEDSQDLARAEIVLITVKPGSTSAKALSILSEMKNASVDQVRFLKMYLKGIGKGVLEQYRDTGLKSAVTLDALSKARDISLFNISKSLQDQAGQMSKVTEANKRKHSVFELDQLRSDKNNEEIFRRIDRNKKNLEQECEA